MANNIITVEKLTTFLTEAPRTVAQVAAEFTVTTTTARKRLVGLQKAGTIKAAGTQPTGRRGRPSTLYTA